MSRFGYFTILHCHFSFWFFNFKLDRTPDIAKSFSTLAASSRYSFLFAPGFAIMTQSKPGKTFFKTAATAARNRRLSLFRAVAFLDTRLDTTKQKRATAESLAAVLHTNKPNLRLFGLASARLISFSFLRRLAGGNMDVEIKQ